MRFKLLFLILLPLTLFSCAIIFLSEDEFKKNSKTSNLSKLTVNDYLYAVSTKGIHGFKINSDGSLTALANPLISFAPDLTTPIIHSGIYTFAGNTFIYTAANGDYFFAGYRIANDGSLSICNPPFNTPGIFPHSFSIKNNFLYVSGYGALTYYKFSINPSTGSLTDLPSVSPNNFEASLYCTLTDDSIPYIIASYNTGYMRRYNYIETDGTFPTHSNNTNPFTISNFDNMIKHPILNYIYINNNTSTNSNHIGRMDIANISTGNLLTSTSALNGLPTTTTQDMEINISRNILFTTTGNGNMYGFDINPADGALTANPNYTTNIGAGLSRITISPNNNFLYVSYNLQVIAGYNIITTGPTLPPITGSVVSVIGTINDLFVIRKTY